MKTFLYLPVLFLFTYSVKAQGTNSIRILQGAWQSTAYNNSETVVKLIRGNNSLGIAHSNNSFNLDFYLSESVVGFQDEKGDKNDSLNIKSLHADGKYFTEILDTKYINSGGWVKMKYCVMPAYFECDGNVMSINATGKLTEYSKIDRLPNFTLSLLLRRGQRDNRNYIKEYLGIELTEITTATSFIHSQPNQLTKMYLIKGDVVTILEETKNWLKIEYNGTKLVQGWIRRKDIE